MAKLRISERKFNKVGFGGAYPIEGDFVDHQQLDITTHQESNPFNAETEYVSLYAEVACFFSIGAVGSTIAVDGKGEFLAAGERMPRAVKAGQIISVVAAT
jgi:hypothetical protein